MGWAWTESDQVVAASSGSWDFAPHRLEGGGMRFLRFRRHFIDSRCSCGGMGPDDDGACVACLIYHDYRARGAAGGETE